MEMRRVFIVYKSPLFAQGLRALLSTVPGLEVVGIGPAKTAERKAWSDLRRLAPEVIILEQGDETPLAAVLDAVPHSQLVTVSLSHNRVRVYAQRDIEGQGLEAVIEAIAEASKGL